VSERLWGQIVRKLQVTPLSMPVLLLSHAAAAGPYSMRQRAVPHPRHVRAAAAAAALSRRSLRAGMSGGCGQ